MRCLVKHPEGDHLLIGLSWNRVRKHHGNVRSAGGKLKIICAYVVLIAVPSRLSMSSDS